MSALLKVGMLSLGCPRNMVDSENILGRLSLKGYKIVDMDKADIAIVNTCAFIKDAKVESIDAILDLVSLKKEGKLKKIIVQGCLVQRYKDTLRKELPEVDAFVGRISLNHERRKFSLTPAHYAYLKICEGCINCCSYCVIPKIKGKFSSLPVGDILEKAAALDREGIRELNIIGQDITGYGSDISSGVRLAELVKKITSVAPHIHWIRLLYLYPSRISNELIEVVRDYPQLCKYIDMPIQHINDRILKLMRRNTTKKRIIAQIEHIRRRIPQVALRTSLIVGFPSETESEFKELRSFVEDVRFERLGVFMYSREEGTSAYHMRPQVPAKIMQKRFDELMSCQRTVSEENNRRYLGTTLEVLIEEQEGQRYIGRSQYDAPEVDGVVYVSSKKQRKPGDFVKARITDTLEYDLVGEAVY